MKRNYKLIKNFFLFFYFVFSITLIVYIFSYYSLQKGKTYNLFWIKSIQQNLYWAGFAKSFSQNIDCVKFHKKLLYVPREGNCNFSNAEFNTNLFFTKHFRINENINKLENTDAIAVIGDSVTMGWGVNNSETFSAIIEKKFNKKVFNFGVAGYGTHRQIIRFIESPYYKKINKVILQYHFNDLQENRSFDDNKFYSYNEFDSLTKKVKLTNFEKAFFALRKFKTSFRMFYRDFKDLFIIKKNPDFSLHLKKVLKTLEKYNYLDGKEILFFYVNSHNLKFDGYETGKIKNIEFIDVNLNTKEHFFIVDDHLNSKGHEELAKQIWKNIQKKNW